MARVEREVQETIAKFLSGRSSLSSGALLTVAKVMMPGDLRSAKVYVSVLLPSEDRRKPQEVIDRIQDHAAEIQDYLSHDLQLRFCPKLKFFLDETTEKILHIEKIIDQMNDRQKTDPTLAQDSLERMTDPKKIK